MSRHTTFRLETLDGTVIAYLAPDTNVAPAGQNDVKGAARAGDREPIRRDFRLIGKEIQITGKIDHSDNLRDAHKTDLKSVFGSLPVTPEDQLNRVWYYFEDVGGPYAFYDHTNEYTSTNASGIDRQNGVFPNVQIGKFREHARPGKSYREYQLTLQPGLER